MACHCEEGSCHCEEERSKKAVIVFASRIALSLALALLGHFLLSEERVGLGWNLFVMLVAYAIIGYDILYKAFRSFFIEHEWFDECALMVLASAGAFALRAYGPDHNEFLEAVLVILLYQVGEFFQDLAADASRDAIVASLDLRKEKAMVERDGRLIETEAEDLRQGDVVRVSAGVKIQCDGLILEGQGHVDESSLTGEAYPVFKAKGGTVRSGTLLSEGSLRVQVTADYENSTSARLIHLIEEGVEEKSKTQRFITKFAKVYTPIVIVLAVLLAVIPPLFMGIGDGAIWSKWIYVALSALVISCPCAVVISVPLAYFAGLGLAAKNGILVKGATYFDASSSLTDIAFDKTGTLTNGNIQIAEVNILGDSNQETLLRCAKAESLSSHPLAKAVHGLYPNATLTKDDTVTEIAGQGIVATIDGHEVIIGSRILLLERGIQAPEDLVALGVYVAEDGVYKGTVSCRDFVKSKSKQTIEELCKKGIKTTILSGDKEAVAASVASDLGCAYAAELLPEDKQNKLREMKEASSGTVAYCGDGINDAPTLALADIGIAMGKGGADAALEYGDVVITDDDPSRIIDFLKIAQATKRRAIFDIAFSLTIKTLVLVLAMTAALTGAFYLPLWVAVVADSGLAVLVVLYSLLLSFKKVR